MRQDAAHTMNVDIIKHRMLEGNPRRISAPEMNNHLRVAAEQNTVDLGPCRDLAEPYLRSKKIADSSGKYSRENTFVAHSQCDMLEVDPSDKSTWLFDLSKMVWWHMPTLYADYAGLKQHMMLEIRGFAGCEQSLSLDLKIGKYPTLRFMWSKTGSKTGCCVEDDNKSLLNLLVMMSAYDCMRYMLVKMHSLKALGKFVDWRDKVRELDDSKLEMPCRLDARFDGKFDSHSEQGEPSKGTAWQTTADAVLEQLNMEAEIIREGSDEPQCKKRRLLNNKMKVSLVEGTRAQAENIRAQAENTRAQAENTRALLEAQAENTRALLEICREGMQLV